MNADLSEWVTRKRSELSRAPRVDVRNVTPSMRDFTHAVSTQRSSLSVIAELARASPEEGALSPSPDYPAMVEALDGADVSAIAVATDPSVSRGAMPDLTLVSRATSSAVVQRDLILVREQLYHARLAGADAVLLHAAALSAADLKAFVEICASMHMAAPVEVCSAEELALAASVGARVAVIPAFGAPHASLSLELCHELLPKVPRTVAPLVRGPFYRVEELAALQGKADGVWICGPVMRAGDVQAFLGPFVAAASAL